MEEESSAAARRQYWCYACLRMVETDTVNCPNCQSGFVEEMPSPPTGNADVAPATDSERALALWAPILLGMLTQPRQRRRNRRPESEDNEESNINNNDDHHNNNNNNQDDDDNNNGHVERETELDRELESIIRRRRRSSAAILQILQGIRAGILADSGNPETGDRDRERVILINPINQTIIVQGGGVGGAASFDNNQTVAGIDRMPPIGSLGDYFIGPGLDLLLQHLSENDPNRYGTPPAQKEAIEALPTLKVQGAALQCCICLDECELDSEVKEMPCKHKFHSGCILPWLELHSSCPICRYQLPSKVETPAGEGSRNNNAIDRITDGGNNDNAPAPPLPWPFSALLPFSSNPASPLPSIPSASSEAPTSANANAAPHEDGHD